MQCLSCRGADLERALGALVFGLRFNGSFTCMGPRRLFLVGLAESEVSQFEARLEGELAKLESVPLPSATIRLLKEMTDDARSRGGVVRLHGLRHDTQASASATMIVHAKPEMLCMRTGLFAPILSVMRAATVEDALVANAAWTTR